LNLCTVLSPSFGMDLCERARAIRENVVGPEHPTTISCVAIWLAFFWPPAARPKHSPPAKLPRRLRKNSRKKSSRDQGRRPGHRRCSRRPQPQQRGGSATQPQWSRTLYPPRGIISPGFIYGTSNAGSGRRPPHQELTQFWKLRKLRPANDFVTLMLCNSMDTNASRACGALNPIGRPLNTDALVGRRR
jgi:hypothetical protein